MSDKKDYCLGYYNSKHKFQVVFEHNSLNYMWRVKKRIEDKRPDAELLIKKRG